jgi:hypothetical protein
MHVFLHYKYPLPERKRIAGVRFDPFVLDRSREKPRPTARRMFVGLSAGTQTRPKFGRSFRKSDVGATSSKAKKKAPPPKRSENIPT